MVDLDLIIDRDKYINQSDDYFKSNMYVMFNHSSSVHTKGKLQKKAKKKSKAQN